MDTGVITDTSDDKDLLFSNIERHSSAHTDSILEITSKKQKVFNQGELNMCVACAVTTLFNFLYGYDDLSKLFIYYNARIDKTKDTGASIRNALKGIAKYGIAIESKWPFDNLMRFNKEPPKEVYASALKIKFNYYKIITLNDMRNCIKDRVPFVFNMVRFSNFNNLINGVMSMPTHLDKPIGRHAMVCVGYNDNTKRFIVQNSMGSGWGNKGFLEIPYSYLTEPKLCTDMWTARLIK